MLRNVAVATLVALMGGAVLWAANHIQKTASTRQRLAAPLRRVAGLIPARKMRDAVSVVTAGLREVLAAAKTALDNSSVLVALTSGVHRVLNAAKTIRGDWSALVALITGLFVSAWVASAPWVMDNWAESHQWWAWFVSFWVTSILGATPVLWLKSRANSITADNPALRTLRLLASAPATAAQRRLSKTGYFAVIGGALPFNFGHPMIALAYVAGVVLLVAGLYMRLQRRQTPDEPPSPHTQTPPPPPGYDPRSGQWFTPQPLPALQGRARVSFKVLFVLGLTLLAAGVGVVLVIAITDPLSDHYYAAPDWAYFDTLTGLFAAIGAFGGLLGGLSLGGLVIRRERKNDPYRPNTDPERASLGMFVGALLGLVAFGALSLGTAIAATPNGDSNAHVPTPRTSTGGYATPTGVAADFVTFDWPQTLHDQPTAKTLVTQDCLERRCTPEHKAWKKGLPIQDVSVASRTESSAQIEISDKAGYYQTVTVVKTDNGWLVDHVERPSR